MGYENLGISCRKLKGLEGVLNPVAARSFVVRRDSYYVKAAGGVLILWIGEKKMLCRPNQLPLFQGCNSAFWAPVAITLSVPYFDKNDRRLVLHDQVNFTHSAVIIRFN